MIRRSIGLLLSAVLVASPARAGDASGAFAPYEDLVGVVAELTWHLDDDLYRFPAAKDALQHDVFQLALHRLQSWQRRFPSRMRDVAGFAAANALVRLREYKGAADLFQQVASLPSSPLAARAREEAQRLAPFVAAAAMPEDADDLNGRFLTLRKKLDVWGKVVDARLPPAYHALALVEEERLERAVAALVTDHRGAIKDGAATAERALRFLIEKHAESKLLPLHVLALGDFYAELARNYVTAHDRALAFDEDDFGRLADRALDVYRKVATWDGAKEKPDGQARLASLDAFKTTTIARYR
jgi:hypothetical protein